MPSLPPGHPTGSSAMNASGVAHRTFYGRVTVIESITPLVVSISIHLHLAAQSRCYAFLFPSCRRSQISKHRAFASLGSSQQYRPFRAKRKPFGLLFIRPPTTHAGPVACRPSPLGFAACASLPCVRSSAATPLPLSLRSLSLVGGATPLGVAGRSPLRSDPRLRFGHPARPPLGHLRCSVLCAFSGA